MSDTSGTATSEPGTATSEPGAATSAPPWRVYRSLGATFATVFTGALWGVLVFTLFALGSWWLALLVSGLLVPLFLWFLPARVRVRGDVLELVGLGRRIRVRRRDVQGILARPGGFGPARSPRLVLVTGTAVPLTGLCGFAVMPTASPLAVELAGQLGVPVLDGS